MDRKILNFLTVQEFKDLAMSWCPSPNEINCPGVILGDACEKCWSKYIIVKINTSTEYELKNFFNEMKAKIKESK